nr:MAG TPA: hypothetical protein [Inoviridae sp.]
MPPVDTSSVRVSLSGSTKPNARRASRQHPAGEKQRT